MRAVLATAFILASSAAWAQCANVGGLICGAQGVTSASVSGAGTLIGGSATSFSGSATALAGNRVTLGNAAGSTNLGACIVNLPALANVTYTTADSRLCVSGLQSAAPAPRDNAGLYTAAGVVGAAGVAALILVNNGKKTVSP